MATTFEESKQALIEEINRRVEDKIIEKSNADLLIKLINQAALFKKCVIHIPIL